MRLVTDSSVAIETLWRFLSYRGTGTGIASAIQKLLLLKPQGVGRFTEIGIPGPEIMAPFVGVCQTVFGVLFTLGPLTRFAAITMIIECQRNGGSKSLLAPNGFSGTDG
jgi:DoxX